MKKKSHGGSRPKAGRPFTGRKPFLISVRPETMRALRHLVRVNKFSCVGELLESDYNSEVFRAKAK